MFTYRLDVIDDWHQEIIVKISFRSNCMAFYFLVKFLHVSVCVCVRAPDFNVLDVFHCMVLGCV